MKKQWLIVGIIVTLITIGAIIGTRLAPDIFPVEVGAKAPQFRAVNIDSARDSVTLDKWKGQGDQTQKQFNGKAVYDFGDDSRVGALLTTSSRHENDYQDLSLALEKRNGWNWDNFRPDWNRAVAVATQYQTTGTVNDGNVQSVDDAYYDASGLRDDTVASVFGDFALSEAVRLKATGYYHNDRGQGHW